MKSRMETRSRRLWATQSRTAALSTTPQGVLSEGGSTTVGLVSRAAIAVFLMALCACGGADRDEPSGSFGELAQAAPHTGLKAENGAGGGWGDADCEEEDTRSCKIDLGDTNGVATCFVGVEICIDGEWSSCGEAPEEEG